ncbi:p115 like vesicle tethering protein [Globomyces pollinis-pini]|nr:p115 like vesicle tethering protein [Globomyces pollinis-pini]
MDYFFSRPQQQDPTPKDATATIDKLCDRLRDATLLEDRRSAVQGLRALARDWQLLVGTKAIPAFITVLRNDRMDVEIIKLTLETLNILCSVTGEDINLASQLTEIFIKDSSNITLILDILAELDFYVRFNSVQLLTTLFGNVGSALHEGILTSPLGISRLIDLLDDRREIIRNDGLLLLISLTEKNADIQKIVAFENAFERLFTIIFDEGTIDGGIIVQDCLQLMQNLLRHNASNQNLFRETSCIKQVPKLLVSRFEHPNGEVKEVSLCDISEWSEQKTQNTIFVLELIKVLVEGVNQNTVVNQNLLGQSNIIRTLFETSMAKVVPNEVRNHALLAIADIIKHNDVNRDRFSKCTMKSNESDISSVMAILQTSINKNDFFERVCSAYLFRSFIEDNMDGQVFVASSVLPQNSTPIGTLLVTSLTDLSLSVRDPLRIWFSSNALMHSLFHNTHAQDICLSAHFEEHGESIVFLHKVCYSLLCASRDGLDHRVQIGLLSLLIVWAFDNTKVVKEFLSEGSNMQFLVEQISQSSGIDPVVQGLSVFLYGVLYKFNDDTEPDQPAKSCDKVQRLKETKAVAANDKVNATKEEDLALDPIFLEFTRTHLDTIVKGVTVIAKKVSGKVAVNQNNTNEFESMKEKLKELTESLKKKDDEIAQLREQIAQSDLNAKQTNVLVDVEELKHLREKVIEKDEYIRAIEEDQEDLYLLTADQEIEIAELKEKLKAYGEVFPDE